MSLKSKISLGLIAILLLTIISFSTFFYYVNKIGTTASTMLDRDYRSVQVAGDLIDSLTKTSSEFERYSCHMHQVYAAPDQKLLLFSVLHRHHEIMMDRCLALTFTHHEMIKKRDEEVQSLYFRAKVITFLITFLILLLVVWVIYRMPGESVRPSREMRSKIKGIMQGKFSQKMEAQPRELVELVRSFNLAGEKLQETEEKFWLFTSNLYDVVFFSKPNAEVFYSTPSITQLLGYTPEEILNKSMDHLLHPEDQKQMKTTLAAVIKTPLQRHVPSELRVRRKDEKYIWMEADFIAQTDAHQQLTYVQCTFRDISERKLAEQKIIQALQKEKRLNKQLTKAQAEIDQFVYSTSHNLRGPLASILGMVNLLKHIKSNQKKRFMMLDLVERSIQRLNDTIHEITDYARNNRLALKIESVELAAIIQDTIESLQYLPAMQNFKITCDIEENVIFHSDSRRLQVVFNNLISNAIKYQNPVQEYPFLKITVASSAHKVTIILEDNGIGILDEHQEKVFDMFYRATELSNGSGLGLYLVKETLGKLKGRIQVNSVYGEGTVFTIEIPDLRPKDKEAKRKK